MLSVSYAGKNAYSTGKTSRVLRADASGANRGYVLGAPPLWGRGVYLNPIQCYYVQYSKAAGQNVSHNISLYLDQTI